MAALARKTLRCGEACDQVATSAEFQLAQRASLRVNLERIPHHLWAIREADAEMLRQEMGTAATVHTFWRRLELSIRIHRALDSGGEAISDLRILSEALLSPNCIRDLQAAAGREVRRATVSAPERLALGQRVKFAGKDAGPLIVSWQRAHPDIARIFPAPSLSWRRAERELQLCFQLEERVRSPGVLSVARPAIALWDEANRRGELVQRGVLRWQSTPTLRSG
jgi:hypothetical protein